MPDKPLTFHCPKCQIGTLGKPNEKNDVVCDKCGRRWRLQPDHSGIMGAQTILKVDNVRQSSSAQKVGGSK